MPYFVINGDRFEFSGQFEEDIRDVAVEAAASHSGVVYPKITQKTRMARVDQVKIFPGDVEAFIDFVNSCASVQDGFTLTKYRSTKCANLDEPGNRTDYFDCLIVGDPKYRCNDNEITGFEFSFERRRASGAQDANANFGQIPAGVF